MMEAVTRPNVVQLSKDKDLERLTVAFCTMGNPISIDSAVRLGTRMTNEHRTRDLDTERNRTQEYYDFYFNVMIDLLTSGIYMDRYEQFEYGTN